MSEAQVVIDPQPEPIKVIFLRVPESLYLAAKAVAEKDGVSINETGIGALRAWCEAAEESIEESK